MIYSFELLLTNRRPIDSILQRDKKNYYSYHSVYALQLRVCNNNIKFILDVDFVAKLLLPPSQDFSFQ